MHLYFITRGVKQQRDLFVKFMQTQMWMAKWKNTESGKDEHLQIQGALRPIELWEYVFPEEAMEEVLTALEIAPYSKETEVSTPGGIPMKSIKFKALRRMLGSDVMPIPDYKQKPSLHYIEKKGVAIYPIGIKKDKRADTKRTKEKVLITGADGEGEETEKKDWGYSQELL